jgi:hypothetical protein
MIPRVTDPARPIVVVSGSRTLTNTLQVIRAFTSARERAGFTGLLRLRDPLWLHGGARNSRREPTVDLIVAAHLVDLGCTVQEIRPDWNRYGKSAGFIRNGHMVDLAAVAPLGAVIAIWDGRSSGTRNAIEHAAERRVPCYVEILHPPSGGKP